MRRLSRVLVPVIVAILLSACGLGLKKEEVKLAPDQAWKTALANAGMLQSLKGITRISVEMPEGAQSFDSEVFYAAPDSMAIRIEYAFGTTAAEMVILGDRFLFYNAMNDNFLSGSVHDEFPKKFFQLPVSMGAFSRLLIAAVDPPVNYSGLKVTDLGDSYLYEGPVGAERWYFTIDSYLGVITRLEIYDGQKKLLLTEEFSNFTRQNGVIFPGRIVFKRPDAGQYVAVTYRELETNIPIPPETFNVVIPPSAKQLDYGF